MKKVLLLYIIFLLCVSGVWAQGMMHYGIKGGFTMANINGDDVPDDTDPRNGFTGGIFGIFPMNDMLAIQPEVLYVMKGHTRKSHNERSSQDINYKLDYIEVPILACVMLPLAFPVNIMAGPSIGFNLSADIERQDTDYDIKDWVKSTDFGVAFGIGTIMRNVTFDVRYTMGVISVDDSEEEYDIKNNVFSIMLGFLFK